MKFNAKIAQDLAVWGGATGVAMLGAAATQSWDSREHRISNIGALAAILVAALKQIPDMQDDPAPAQPAGDPTHA